MSKVAIGKITCPIAAAAGDPHEGEVFEQAGRKRGQYYYRCACGTIQPLLGDGQANMRVLMRALTLEEGDQAAADAAADAEAEARDAVKGGRKNALWNMVKNLVQEEESSE